MNDRAARRERIGRRPGGRRHDQAVGTVTRDRRTIDKKIELQHARERRFRDDGVIEAAVAVDALAVTQDVCVKNHAFAERIAARKNRFENGIKLVQCDAGKKSEAAEIDGENGNLLATE